MSNFWLMAMLLYLCTFGGCPDPARSGQPREHEASLLPGPTGLGPSCHRRPLFGARLASCQKSGVKLVPTHFPRFFAFDGKFAHHLHFGVSFGAQSSPCLFSGNKSCLGLTSVAAIFLPFFGVEGNTIKALTTPATEPNRWVSLWRPLSCDAPARVTPS